MPVKLANALEYLNVPTFRDRRHRSDAVFINFYFDSNFVLPLGYCAS
jgi:hypothetical protein